MIETKKIVITAREILNRLYMLLDENSSRLIVNADIDNLAKDINVTNNQIRISIHYLILLGYLRVTDGTSYERNYGNEIELTIAPVVIDKLENNAIFK